MKRTGLLLPLAMLAAACTPAQMRLPESLASGAQERVTFESMSNWTIGRFVAGEYSGSYERGLDRESVANIVNFTDGHAEFVIEGPGISSTIEGRCGVRERALTFDDVEFKPAPMAYRCELTAGGRPFPARFELQENRRGLANMLTRNARRGEVAIAGQVVSFRSVHTIEGTSLPVENPIGYVFEQDGKPVGALELNGKPVLVLPAGTDIDRRRAMMIAAIALSTFWDPAAVEA